MDATLLSSYPEDLRSLVGEDVYDAEAVWLGRLVERQGRFYAERPLHRRVPVGTRAVQVAGREALYLELPRRCYLPS